MAVRSISDDDTPSVFAVGTPSGASPWLSGSSRRTQIVSGSMTSREPIPRITKLVRQPSRRMHHMARGTRIAMPAIEAEPRKLIVTPRRFTNQFASVTEPMTWPVAARPSEPITA